MDPNTGKLYPTLDAAHLAGIKDAVEISGAPMSDEFTPTTAFVRKHYAQGATAYFEGGTPAKFPSPADVAFAARQFNRWLSSVESVAERRGAVKALRVAKSVVRGEGEPGHGGEMVAVNYVDELLDDLAAEFESGERDL